MSPTPSTPITTLPKPMPPDGQIHEFAYLRLYVDESTPEDFRQLYRDHVAAHNAALGLAELADSGEPVLTGSFPNSGFDLLTPYETPVPAAVPCTMLKLKVKAEMFEVYGHYRTPTAYFLMPRSSIAKTPLMQANHIGLIDMGYRGEIMAAVRNLDGGATGATYTVEEHSRLFQLCHPKALPIWVELVDRAEDLSSTDRGAGGFGSTGTRGVVTGSG